MTPSDHVPDHVSHHPPEVPPPVAAVPPTDPPTDPPTVLVVDDLEDTRRVLAGLLRLGGYRPVKAADGPAALRAVEGEAPDLVLLDLHMPGMDGAEVLRRLREDPRWRDLPVILFTAVCHGPLIERVGRLGVRDFIFKGNVGSWDLLGRVAEHLPPSRKAPGSRQPHGSGHPN